MSCVCQGAAGSAIGCFEVNIALRQNVCIAVQYSHDGMLREVYSRTQRMELKVKDRDKK